MLDHEGKEVPGNRGYKLVYYSSGYDWCTHMLTCTLLNFALHLHCRYFGAARDLPGVRELFQQQG